MTTWSWVLVGFAVSLAINMPLIIVVAAKCVAYGSAKGRWLFQQELKKRKTSDGTTKRP